MLFADDTIRSHPDRYGTRAVSTDPAREHHALLGFKVSDIRIILSGHAHFDHVAGHADMKAASGARQVFASAADAMVLESGGKKGFHPIGDYKPVKVDRIIKDKDNVKLGKWTLTASHTRSYRG